ncbi:MAG: hypothetical protein WAN20_17085 [Pseudonocardiaceae bacterium]|jgi:hypothetical protein|nr:hypothetical protein [Pseudonocardiaceae bacterium]
MRITEIFSLGREGYGHGDRRWHDEGWSNRGHDNWDDRGHRNWDNWSHDNRGNC